MILLSLKHYAYCTDLFSNFLAVFMLEYWHTNRRKVLYGLSFMAAMSNCPSQLQQRVFEPTLGAMVWFTVCWSDKKIIVSFEQGRGWDQIFQFSPWIEAVTNVFPLEWDFYVVRVFLFIVWMAELGQICHEFTVVPKGYTKKWKCTTQPNVISNLYDFLSYGSVNWMKVNVG